MTLAGIDYTGPEHNGRLDAWPDRQATGNAARAGKAAQSHRRPAGKNHRFAGAGGESAFVQADHIEYWHKLQSPAPVASAAIPHKRRPVGGELYGAGNRRADKGFRRSPVAWIFLVLAVAIFFGHLMLQIGKDQSHDSFADCVASKGLVICPPIWNGVGGR